MKFRTWGAMKLTIWDAMKFKLQGSTVRFFRFGVSEEMAGVTWEPWEQGGGTGYGGEGRLALRRQSADSFFALFFSSQSLSASCFTSSQSSD